MDTVLVRAIHKHYIGGTIPLITVEQTRLVSVVMVFFLRQCQPFDHGSYLQFN